MRKLNLSIALILCTVVTFAQSADYQSLLWKISGNGLEKPSFLYGTMHVSNKVAFHLSDSFYKAIKSVDIVALEINPETWMETMTSDQYIADQMGNVFSMRGDYSNTGFYKKIYELEQPENLRVGEALGQELGILNSLLYRTSNYNAEFQEDTYLDLFIYQAGRKQGKEVTGLENLGLTMKLNEEAEQPVTDKDLKKKIKEENERKRHELQKLLDGKSFGEVMEDAYRRGDLDLLDSISRLSTYNDKHHDLIIVYRNELMAIAMDSIMQKKSLFAGIGAAHLPNTYGVVNLLREMGYTVTAVKNEKGEYGRETKDWLEHKFITHSFEKKTSFDGSFSTNMPGPLYEFPEANDVMMSAYPDMANGATYVITRILTYAPLHNMTQEQYMDKIDSLLYENIPGKIHENKRVNISGYPAFDILNKTKKGDFQRYNIVVTPIEIIILKVGGKKEYVKRNEVNTFFNQLEFANDHGGQWQWYQPSNTAYKVEMPGNMVYEGENNAFTRGYWKKTVQSFDPKDKSYYGVLNRSYSDLRFIEEDTFELNQIVKQFVEQFDYKLSSTKLEFSNGRHSVLASATKEGMPDLHMKMICKSEQYYLLFAQTSDKASADRFISSFSFETFTYKRPFEMQEDTTMFYNVMSPVEKAKRYSYYGYYRNSDDDKDYEEKNLNTSYYNRETDETVNVYYKKFHDYDYEPNVDSVWAGRSEILTQEEDFYVLNHKQWEKDGIHYMEMEVGDTNSQRSILGKFILKGGVMYSLKTEKEQDKARTKFIETFYETFEPWDTAIGYSILENKTEKFLADLRSEDSLTREGAFESLEEIEFEDENAPQVIAAIDKSYDDENSIEIKSSLFDHLVWLEHPAILPYVKQKYYKVGDTINYQLPILQAIANHKTKQTTSLFLELLEDETPLSNESYKISKLFYPFADSLELAKELYPDLFMFASLSEYKYKVYYYLAISKDSGLISKKLYKKQVKQIAWEANNEAKRQKSKEAGYSSDYWEKANAYKRYSYSNSLYNYAVLLLPYEDCKSDVKKYFQRLDELQSPGLRMDIAILKAKNDYYVPDSVWASFSKDGNDRIYLYSGLKKEGLLHLFPQHSINQQELALSLFCRWNDVNAARDTVTFVKRIHTSIEDDSGYVYFFKYKARYGDDWKMGYLGLEPKDTMTFDLHPEHSNDYMKYTKFEDLDLQMEMQIRKLQMEKRKRYRVADEERFKVLNTKRGYYGYY